MPNQLVFKSHTLEAIDHEGKLWFTAATLASALEYSRGDKITQIYNRNADEFTPCMTTVLENLNLRFSIKSMGYNIKRPAFSLCAALT
ncbi:Uncharacterised protein [Klebsiella pneumoniae]|nr:Uncharacterised protein [Klebsiella pneumoniae]HBY9791595.1 hypothetical protein [Klebsiella pneumoniae]